MKYLSGRMSRLCIIVFAVFAFAASGVLADEGRIEFILGSNNCGGNVVRATAGEATLRASADGVNSEKIRWDTDTARLAPRMQGKKLAAGRGEGGYWLIEFSAGGLSNMTFSADMFSTGNATKSFAIYYSTDGADFTAVDGSEVALSKSSRTIYGDFPLPRELNNSKTVYIKLMINSKETVNGSDITGVRDGSTYINNIIIKGSGEVKPDDDKKEEKEEKAYYSAGENLPMRRIGGETGKYKFSVKLTQ